MPFNSDSTAAALLREAQDIKTVVAAMQERLSTINATLALAGTGKHSIPDVGTFTVSENNVYDEAVMREALSPGQVRRCSRTVLDKPTVKRLYPAAYEAAKNRRGHKVTIG